MKLFPAAGLFAVLAGCAASTVPKSLTAVTPVDIWTGGDDALTQRLSDAVEDEFRRSVHFSYGQAGDVPGALKVIIPTHVDSRQVGDRTRVTYRLELERDGRKRGAKGGSCWDNDLQLCAQQVVRSVAATVR